MLRNKVCAFSRLFFQDSKGILWIALLLLCLAACSNQQQVNTFPSLANQGQLALSTTNPYLGANLFLGKELEKSSYLFNFFKGRGAPTAIEILQDGRGPTRVLLYYPGEKETYSADLLTRGDNIEYRQWIVRGPYQIERQDYKNLARMQLAMNGVPVFKVRGKTHRFLPDTDDFERPEILSPLPPPLPTPKPRPKSRPKPKPKVVYQSSTDNPNEVQSVDPNKWQPLNTDQQAINIAKGFAERASNGDIIHTVRVASRTYESIARWYTGSASNAESIATYNLMSAGDHLQSGMRIRVPLKLIKEFKAMPASFENPESEATHSETISPPHPIGGVAKGTSTSDTDHGKPKEHSHEHPSSDQH